MVAENIQGQPFYRFRAHRRIHDVFYSDNGFSFKGDVYSKMRILYHEAVNAVLHDDATWVYVTSLVPNLGGLWKANIRSQKQCLYKVIG